MEEITIQILISAISTIILYFLQNRKLIKTNQKEINKLKSFLLIRNYEKEIEEEVKGKSI